MSNYSEIISWPSDVPDRRVINGSLEGARNSTMQTLIGLPCSNLSKDCQSPSNPEFIKLVVSEDVGPFKARGLKPAVESLRNIFADIQRDEPDLYERLGSAGMLCCRWVRGSTSVMSNHSWGTAIDLTIDGKLDPLGDNKVQRGLLIIFKYFNRHGWFWGAAFGREDAMHFEASDQLIRQWASEGHFGGNNHQLGLTIGDRGVEVESLQSALNSKLGLEIQVDGRFGPLTHGAVIQFQKYEGLVPDGIVGPRTKKALSQ